MAPKTRVGQLRGTFLHRIGGLFAGAMLLSQPGVVLSAAYQPSNSNQPHSGQYIAEYQPPSESAPVNGTNPNTSSSRGVCDDTVGGSLLLTLAPQSPGISQDDGGRIGQLIYSPITRSSPGLMAASLSEEHPGLTPEYLSIWKIVVPCNPSSSAIAQAPINIGPPPASSSPSELCLVLGICGARSAPHIPGKVALVDY